MKFFIQTFCVCILINMSVYATPVIQYKQDEQRYTFPDKTISADVFFTEFSQFSGIEVYYYPGLIIPDDFRGLSLQEDSLLRLFEKKFSIIKSFNSEQLASLQILPEGQFQSNNLRRAGATLVEAPQSSVVINESPALLSDQRVRVLQAKESREQALADLKVKKAEKAEQRKARKADKKAQREERKMANKKIELNKLKTFYDTDKEVYERLLPFYEHKYGAPDFSELDVNDPS